MSVSCECSVVRWADHLSRGVLPSIIRVTDCDREACAMGRPWPTRGCHAMKKKKIISLTRYNKNFAKNALHCHRALMSGFLSRYIVLPESHT
jgi:hypothetical protein